MHFSIKRYLFKPLVPLLFLKLGGALVSGKIISQVGDELVIQTASNETPKIGDTVSCESQAIGRVYDIIGNAKNPYPVAKLAKTLNKKKFIDKNVEVKNAKKANKKNRKKGK